MSSESCCMSDGSPVLVWTSSHSILGHPKGTAEPFGDTLTSPGLSPNPNLARCLPSDLNLTPLTEATLSHLGCQSPWLTSSPPLASGIVGQPF